MPSDTLYEFKFTAEPTAAARNAEDVGEGTVIVFVLSDTMDNAEATARAYVMGFGWLVLNTEVAHAQTPQQLSRLEEPQAGSMSASPGNKLGIRYFWPLILPSMTCSISSKVALVVCLRLSITTSCK